MSTAGNIRNTCGETKAARTGGIGTPVKDEIGTVINTLRVVEVNVLLRAIYQKGTGGKRRFPTMRLNI